MNEIISLVLFSYNFPNLDMKEFHPLMVKEGHDRSKFSVRIFNRYSEFFGYSSGFPPILNQQPGSVASILPVSS